MYITDVVARIAYKTWMQMPARGKFGMLLLLLILIVPGARLSRRAFPGGVNSWSSWLARVCHHGHGQPGTQRRSPRRPDEPLSALPEQQRTSDSGAGALRPQPVAPLAGNSLVPVIWVRPVPSALFTDPAFLCTFQI